MVRQFVFVPPRLPDEPEVLIERLRRVLMAQMSTRHPEHVTGCRGWSGGGLRRPQPCLKRCVLAQKIIEEMKR